MQRALARIKSQQKPKPRTSSSVLRCGLVGTAVGDTGRAPDAVAAPPGNPRFPLLDGLRAVAASLVLIFHVVVEGAGHNSKTLRNLSVEGIAIFFVLSGFLLFRPFARARLAGEGVPSARAYARRRVLRIVPAYWVAVTFALVVAGGTAIAATHIPIYYLLLQDYFDATRYHGLSVAWTLSIEATYYALLPLLAVLAVAIADRFPSRGRWRLLPELLIVAGFVLVSLLVQVLHPTAPATILSFTDWFAGGMLLAIVTLMLPRGHRRELPSLVAAALWTAALGLFLVANMLPYGVYGAHLVIAVSAIALVAPALFPARRGAVSTILRSPVLLWLGLISYGIYLWHVPLMAAIQDIHRFSSAPLLVLTAGATVAVSAASYYLLEAPILRFKDGQRGRGRRRQAARSA